MLLGVSFIIVRSLCISVGFHGDWKTIFGGVGPWGIQKTMLTFAQKLFVTAILDFKISRLPSDLGGQYWCQTTCFLGQAMCRRKDEMSGQLGFQNGHHVKSMFANLGFQATKRDTSAKN